MYRTFDLTSGRIDPKSRNAVEEVQRIYQRTTFPEMKLNWQIRPNLYSSGCFRCHDGQHVSPAVKVMPKDCNTCTKQMVATPGVSPQVSGDLTQATCTGCHNGGTGPQELCGRANSSPQSGERREFYSSRTRAPQGHSLVRS